MGTVGIVDSELIDLIGSIYDAVLEPVKWHDALDRIRRRFDFHNVILGVVRMGYEPFAYTVSVNIPERYLAMQTPEYNEEAMRMWGGARADGTLPHRGTVRPARRDGSAITRQQQVLSRLWRSARPC